MPDLDLSTVGKLLGGAGVVVWGIYHTIKYLFTKLFDQVAITQAEQSKRIDASEKKHEECEQDRRKLHDQLIVILTEKNK